MTDKTDSKEREPTYLCQAWGETDLPSAAIVQGLDAVREFLVEQWLGDADQEHDDGTKALPAAMADMQEQWALEGEAWKWSISFEIGGISVQRVDDVGRASLAASAGSEPVAQPSDADAILSKICDLFYIGKLARTESTILTNIGNVIDHAGLLHAVERDLFPQPELPEDDDPYAAVDEGLPAPNSWAAKSEADYVAQFRAALAARGFTHPSPPEGMAGWISVDERLPEPGQNVAFVVRANICGSFRLLNGRVLGGRFLPGEGFSIPGLCVDASHWMPLPAPPLPASEAKEL